MSGSGSLLYAGISLTGIGIAIIGLSWFTTKPKKETVRIVPEPHTVLYTEKRGTGEEETPVEIEPSNDSE